MAEGMAVSLNNKIKKVNLACTTLAGIILLFVNVTIFIDVFLRYFFRRPSIWITEVSTYLLLYMIFLGASYALQQGMHIKVTFLRIGWSDRMARFADLLCSLFAMIFCLVLLWQTALMTWSAFKEKWVSPTMLTAPLAYVYVIMVIGSFLLFVTFLLQMIVDFKKPGIPDDRKDER